MRNFKQIFIATALSLGILAPLTAVSAQSSGEPAVTNYDTEMALSFPRMGAGVYAGTLHLSVSANGIVQGSYQTLDGAIEPVAGGKTGDTIWFSIGESGSIRVNGNVLGSHIVGSARDTSSSDTMSFTASPSKQ
jgi:hypothetical protein